MNPILEELLGALADELQRQQPAIYSAGRDLVSSAWAALASNGTEGGPVLRNPGSEGSFLGAIWEPVAKPFAQGAMDELEARIKAMVAPKVKRLMALSAGAGILGGWTAAGWMRR